LKKLRLGLDLATRMHVYEVVCQKSGQYFEVLVDHRAKSCAINLANAVRRRPDRFASDKLGKHEYCE
jgi:hypothetical protein